MNNTVKTALLLGTMSGLLLFIGEALGGAGGMAIGFFFAVATNFASYWFSDKIVLRMYGAQEVGPGHRLYESVRRLAGRAALPMPRVYIIPLTEELPPSVRPRIHCWIGSASSSWR